MDVADRIRAGVKWLSFGKAASQLIAWSFTLVTMRLLSPEDYGLVALAAVFISFVSLFEELGLRVKLVQMQEFDENYVRIVYGLSIATNVILASIVVAASPAIALFFEESRVLPILLVLALQFLVSSLAVIPDAMIKRRIDFRAVTLVDIAQTIAGSATAFSLAWTGFGVWSLVAGNLVATLVKTAGLLYLSPFRKMPRFTLRGMRETLAFGGYVTGQRIIWWLYSRYSTVLLGRLYDAATVGIYSVATTLAYMPLEKLGSVVAVAAFTGLSRVAKDLAVFRAYLLKGVRLLSALAFPVFYGIAAVVAELTPIALGEKWLPIVPVTQLLCLVMPFRMINGPVTESLNALGRPAEAVTNVLIVAVFVIAGVSGGAAWGPLGVAAGWLASFPVAFVVSAAKVGRHAGFGLLQLFATMAPSALSAAVMLVVLYFGRPLLPIAFPSLLGLGATVLIGAAIYVPMLMLFDREGARLVLSVLRRKS